MTGERLMDVVCLLTFYEGSLCFLGKCGAAKDQCSVKAGCTI